MARLTTDKWKVRVHFSSITVKIQHLLRSAQYYVDTGLGLTSSNYGRSDLHDSFTITRTYKDDSDKFKEYFHKGSHTKTWQAKLLSSDQLNDEFEIDVEYGGGAKDFGGIFNKTFRVPGIEIEMDRISTSTKDLGTIRKRKESNDIKIIRAFVEEALSESTLTKSKTVPKNEDRGTYKTTIRAPSGIFWNDDSHSVVCVHLATAKVGIVPDKADMDKVKILVHVPEILGSDYVPYLGIKRVDNFDTLKIVSDYNRFEAIKKFNAQGEYAQNRTSIKSSVYGKNRSNIEDFRLSDPEFFDKLSKFFQEVDEKVSSICTALA